MLFNAKHLTALSLCFGLIGCAAMPSLPDNATPAQRMAYATERHLTQEKSYNFHYNFKVDELSYTPVDEADDADADEVDEVLTTVKSIYNTIQTVTLGVNLDADGAIDMKRGKFEVTPAVRYQTPNVYAKIKLPILVDLGQNSLYVDPAAITNLPLDIEALEKYQQPAGTFFRVTLAEKQALADLKAIAADIPMQDLIRLYADSHAKSLAKLPADSIQMVPVDAWGQSLGAQQQIQLTLSINDYMKYNLDRQLNLFEATMAYVKDYRGSALPAELVATIKNLDMETQQLPRELLNELFDKLSAKTAARLTDPTQLAGIKSLYLDQQHRLLGQQDGLMADIKGLRVRINSRIHYSHFGRPVWQINPKQVTVIDSGVTLLTDEAWSSFIHPSTEAHDDEAFAAEEAEAEAQAAHQDEDDAAATAATEPMSALDASDN